MSYTIHPKLLESLVLQTPRAMLAMLLVSLAYVFIFLRFIPIEILSLWFGLQILLALYRLYNARMFKKYIEENNQEHNQEKIRKNQIYFTLSNIFQACMWTASSILSIIYAPQPFELVSFVLIIGIITAAALSMSSLYKAYLIFFFCMIIPQIIIMLYYCEAQHIGLIILTLIYIPAIILLSKSIYSSRLSSILAHDDLEKNLDKLHKSVIIDNLTNIYNRGYFFEVSSSIITLSSRNKKKVSLLMMDLDYFKKINDTYGHQAGDCILKNFAQEVKKVLRESDIFARIGGEEFTILLDNTSIEGAGIIAKKIRKHIENHTFFYEEKKINITVSIGISCLNNESTTIEDLYKKADEKLYVSKHNGRNTIAF